MIKRISISDISLIQEMINSRDESIQSISNIREFLLNDSNYFLASIVDGKIVGFLLAYVLQRYDGRNEMIYLHEIDVLESHRKQGIAKEMIEELKIICKRNEFDKIFLITNKSNKAAVALYESTEGKKNADDDVVYSYK